MQTTNEAVNKQCIAQFQKLKADIQKLDFVVVGSLREQFRECGKKQCRCHSNADSRHGPYWYWTRKVNAKTVTVLLSESQARNFEKWISNNRELERIIAQMREVSARAAAIAAGLDHSRVAYSKKDRRRGASSRTKQI